MHEVSYHLSYLASDVIKRIAVPSEPFNLINGGNFVCTPAWSLTKARVDDFHRLYIPVSGQAKVTSAGQTLPIRTGWVYLIPGHRPITHVCNRRMQVNWLHFRPSDLVDQMLLNQMGKIHSWPIEQWSYWNETIGQLDMYFAKHALQLAAATQAMLMDKVGQLLADLQDKQTLNDPRGLIHHLAPSITFMDAHALENPPLQVIADSVYLSPSHFHRMFQEAFRLSPHDYMLRQRMTTAFNMLRTGRWRVGEVAIRCGYDNLFYFSRVFKKYHGYTPMNVRKGNISAMP